MTKSAYSNYIDGSAEKLDVNAPTPLTSISPTSSNSEEITASSKKYAYHFGIDSINFTNTKIESNMCFVSDEIEIGTLLEDEYIQLVSSYNTGENGSIEFYILDGSTPKAILPVGTTEVVDEKIFFGYRTRFSIDPDSTVIIKKYGSPINISLDAAIELNEEGYTVSYTPLDAHDITVNNSSIRIKAILRTYDKNNSAPIIKSLAIKKYGRNSLWKDNIIN